MHAETKAELLALKSEMQVRESKTQAEILALKSETQTLKIEMRQMEASMASKFASIEKALMHGKNKTSPVVVAAGPSDNTSILYSVALR